MAVHFGVYACAAALTSRSRTPANGAPLVAAGADFLAVCNAIWGSNDPGGEVAKFDALFAG